MKRAAVMRGKLNFLRPFNAILPVQLSREKYFAGGVGQISFTTRAILSPCRGALRPIVTKRGAGCDGRGSPRATSAATRTAKSCGFGAPTLALSCANEFRAATVARKPGHREEHEGNR
jgi:hypothetical protein